MCQHSKTGSPAALGKKDIAACCWLPHSILQAAEAVNMQFCLCLPLTGDEDEWHEWSQVGDPVLHIELRRWADVFVVAPLSANTLAKMANGLCDNLVTCIARAWDFTRPLIVSVR